MARYINADEFESTLKDAFYVFCKDGNTAMIKGIGWVLAELSLTPDVDVVKVIRCKDCSKRAGTICSSPTELVGICDNDFCSRSEAKAVPLNETDRRR